MYNNVLYIVIIGMLLKLSDIYKIFIGNDRRFIYFLIPQDVSHLCEILYNIQVHGM